MSKTVTRIEQPKIVSRKRVAAYCRVSTDHKAQLESLENQIETFRFRAVQRGDWDLKNVYVDEGLSETLVKVKGRVQFQQMIEDCKAGEIDYIITKSISRSARNTVDTLRTVRDLQSHGVQVFFEKEGIDTATPFLRWC